MSAYADEERRRESQEREDEIREGVACTSYEQLRELGLSWGAIAQVLRTRAAAERALAAGAGTSGGKTEDGTRGEGVQ